jgi:undecaprenyl-diphosphatase
MNHPHVLDRHAGERANPLATRPALAFVGACAVALLWVVHDVRAGVGIVQVDHHVTAFVISHRTPVLNAMATAVTTFGNEVTLLLLTLAMLLTLWLRGQRDQAGFFALAMAGSATLTVVGKHAVMRARPPVGDVVGAVLDRSYSFPSGHTLNSAVFVAALLWVVLPTVSAQVAKAFLVTVGSLLAVGVGLSRVYLGYHWSSDVLGAWLIAALWVTVACSGLAAVRRHPGHHDGRRANLGASPLAVTALAPSTSRRDPDRHVRLEIPTQEQEISDDHAHTRARTPGRCS